MKRLLSHILCLILLCTTACTGTTATTVVFRETETKASTTAEAPLSDNPDSVILTIDAGTTYVNSDKFPSWGEDEISRRIMDITGVKLVFQHNSSLNTLLASQEMPDLICAYSASDIAQLNSPDYAQPLDTLALEHCPQFWNELDALELLTNQQDDGHVYALVNGYITDDVYDDPVIPLNPPRFMSLRTDVLAKLNADIPASVEELEALLYTAKDQMQELGITSVLRQYSPTASPVAEWMGVKRFLQWDAENQKVISPMRDDAWVPYLQLAARWYRDGVMTLPSEETCWRLTDDIPWEYMSNTTPDAYSLYADTNAASFVTASDEYESSNDSLYILQDADGPASKDFPYAIFEAPLTFEGEIRYQAADQNSYMTQLRVRKTSRGALFITNACIKADRAIQFLAFLRGNEGSQLVTWGVEGIHFNHTDDGLVEYKPDYTNSRVNRYYEGNKKHGINYWTFVDNARTLAMLDASPVLCFTNADHLALREMQVRMGLNYKKYAAENKNPVFGLAEPEPGTDAYTRYIQLQDYWHHAVWELVTNSADSEAVAQGWEAINSELITRGIEDVEQAMTVRFTDALSRFQQAGYYTNIVVE